MKKLFLILLLLLVISKSVAQVTIIPDNRFERALIDLGIDSDLTINGQILTSDALLVTELELSPNSLTNYPYPANDFYEGLIHDLNGLEAFVNIERLIINFTMAEDLNINSLINLKYLDCVDNMLTAVDVSNNLLLEYIDITSGGDVTPFNYIPEIDLSNNPNIQEIVAPGIKRINLNNNSNNPNMQIRVGCSFCFDYPTDYIEGSVCIKVDNVELAQSNQEPYSSWIVYHQYYNLNYANDLVQCSLSNAQFNQDKITIYPNPVSSGIVNINSNEKTNLKVEIFDFLGRKILEKDQVNFTIDISRLKKGHYLMKIMSENGIQTEKLIVE